MYDPTKIQEMMMFIINNRADRKHITKEFLEELLTEIELADTALRTGQFKGVDPFNFTLAAEGLSRLDGCRQSARAILNVLKTK